MNWTWITVTAALAAIVIGVGALSRRETDTADANKAPEQPAYYLKDAVITKTGEDGRPEIRLAASRIDQQRNDETIHLSSVRVDYLKAPDKQWFLSAQRGLIPADSHIIQFLGDVELRPSDAPATTFLRTEEISIDSERNVAYTTSSPVSIRFGAYAMDVKRLEADLTTEKVRMEAVNGRTDKS